MSARDRERWNKRHAKCEPLSMVQPDEWLVEALRLIETTAGTTDSVQRILDIACGLGHNAIWLVQQGFQSDAVDISTKGLELARQCATAHDADVSWIEADLDDWIPPANSYDLAVVFRFLDRETVPQVVQTALRPSGWLIYETFSVSQLGRPDNHIHNPTFTLDPGELVALFPDFDVIADREDVLPDRTIQRFLGRRQPSGSRVNHATVCPE